MGRTYLWLLQMVTGVVILVSLSIALVSTHLPVVLNLLGIDAIGQVPEGLAANRANPGVWAGMAGGLVAIILYHALSGLRNTLVELVPSAKKARIISWVIIVSGIIILMGSIYVPVVLFSR